MTPMQGAAAAAEWFPVSALVPWTKNPKINDHKIQEAVSSLRRFGFGNPIVAWRQAEERYYPDGRHQEPGPRIAAGHLRRKAMLAMLAADPGYVLPDAPGPGLVPVRFLSFASEGEFEAYALRDNNEIGDRDEAAIAMIIAENMQAGVDMTGLGWDEDELARMVEDATRQGEGGGAGAGGAGDDRIEANDEAPDVPAEPVTKAGDLWQLGPHRLLCGDATKAEDVTRLLGGATIDLLWTDPPYNVAYTGGTKDGLQILNDEMDDADFRAFLVGAFRNADAVMRPGACVFIAYADKQTYGFHGAVIDVGWKFSSCIVWVKDSLVLGRADYHSRHEPMLYGWKRGAGHNMLEDRTQDTIWEFDRPKRSEVHPTMKPVALVERAIRNATAEGDKVLDPFGGSGTTLIAAAATGRVAFLLELSPNYCDVIVQRWETASGKKAKRTPGPKPRAARAPKAAPAPAEAAAGEPASA